MDLQGHSLRVRRFRLLGIQLLQVFADRWVRLATYLQREAEVCACVDVQRVRRPVQFAHSWTGVVAAEGQGRLWSHLEGVACLESLASHCSLDRQGSCSGRVEPTLVLGS